VEGQSVNFQLYLITDRHQTQGRPLLEVVKAAIDGGVEAVQLRERDLAPRELYPLAVALRGITQEAGVKLLINDRADLAMSVEADGVHLRTDSLPIAVARGLLGQGRLIGVSTHSLQEAQEAEKEGADFITFGPIFYTPSKASLGTPVGSALIREVKRFIRIPLFALGGIQIDRLDEVMTMGADGVGVISAILTSGDVKGRAREFLKTIKRFSKGSSEVHGSR
jgi:thiamine-phosphate pyrophosphorylase